MSKDDSCAREELTGRNPSRSSKTVAHFHGREAKEPVAHVNLVDEQTGLEHNRVRDHGIVGRISVFDDVEAFLNHTAGVQQGPPAGAQSPQTLQIP